MSGIENQEYKYFIGRNEKQQYDDMEVIRSLMNKVARDTHVATLAVVAGMADNNDTVSCIPFPVREGSEPIQISAYNLSGQEYAENDIVLVVFTDRDYRYNRKTVKNDKKTITKTKDNDLHSLSYGICVGPLNVEKTVKREITEVETKISNTYATKEELKNIGEFNGKSGVVIYKNSTEDPVKCTIEENTEFTFTKATASDAEVDIGANPNYGLYGVNFSTGNFDGSKALTIANGSSLPLLVSINGAKANVTVDDTKTILKIYQNRYYRMTFFIYPDMIDAEIREIAKQ